MIVLTLLILFIAAAVGSAALGSPMLFVVRQQEASIIERLASSTVSCSRAFTS